MKKLKKIIQLCSVALFLLLAINTVVLPGIVSANHLPSGPPDTGFYPDYDWSPAGSGDNYRVRQNHRYLPAASVDYNGNGTPDGDYDFERLCTFKTLLVPNAGAFPNNTQYDAYKYLSTTSSAYMEVFLSAYICSNGESGSYIRDVNLRVQAYNSSGTEVFDNTYNDIISNTGDTTTGGAGGDWKRKTLTVTGLDPGTNRVCYKLAGEYVPGGDTSRIETFQNLGYCLYVKYDREPTISATPNCTAKTVRVDVDDPDPGTADFQWRRRSYSTTGVAGAWSSWTTVTNDELYDINMSSLDQTVPHDVEARTRGTDPTGANSDLPYVTDSARYSQSSSNVLVGCVTRAFTITPAPTAPVLKPDNEAATSADFTSNFSLDINPGPGGGLKATMNRSYRIIRANGAITTLTTTPCVSTTNNSGNPWAEGGPIQNCSNNVALPSMNLGDRACLSLGLVLSGGTLNTALPPGTGTVDNGGNVITRGPNPSIELCSAMSNKPYLSVYGGSVLAGSVFAAVEPTCANTGTSKIMARTRYNGGGNSFGSSVQFAAQALGAIEGNDSSEGFYSASNRTPFDGGYLSFANDTWNPPASDWGGNFGRGRCLLDFFDEAHQTTRFDASSPNFITIGGGSIDIAGISGGNQYYSNGNLTITNASSQQFNRRSTVYIKGDVLIAHNILYAINYDTTAENYYENVPYLTVIAEGNIYIDKGVNNLAGLYIAQPDPEAGTGGAVITCTNGFEAVIDANKLADCNGGGGVDSTGGYCKPLNSSWNGAPLSIRGGFIANKIKFMRTNGTLRCANAGTSANKQETYTEEESTGEKFYLAPELFIGFPLFNSSGPNLGGVGDIQSYTSLPPIF